MHDVLIIGGGPGGYVAAIRAKQLGLKTALIEKEALGGVCLNWGCIPSKALLQSAHLLSLIQQANTFGIHVSDVRIDLPAMIARSRAVANKLVKGIEYLVKDVDVIRGTATFKNAHEVAVDGKIYTAKNFIIATGAKARMLPNTQVSQRIWTYKEAMTPPLQEPPQRLLVMGSGAIGMEFGYFYHCLGTKVDVVEMMDRILPQEDEEISRLAQTIFTKKGLRFDLNTSVESLVEDATQVTAKFSNGDTRHYDAVIVAIGVVPNIDTFGIENTKIQTVRNYIRVDTLNRTTEPHIYAIGDVVNPPWLAHKASHEGVHVAEIIAGHKAKSLGPIPACTYCVPQIASVGITEQKAKEMGIAVKIGRFSFRNNGKALAIGEEEGMIKTIFDANTGQLLGCHMIGAEVTEMISSMTVAMNLETTEAELMATIFPHPTLSESIHESVLDAFGQTLHA